MDELKREVISSLERSLELSPESEAYAIFFRGKQVKLRSGKSVWTKASYAKSALTNHTDSIYYMMRNHFVDMNYTELKQAIRRTVNQLIDEGIIEIRQVGNGN